MIDIHTMHCCAECGCKYGDPGCTVLKGIASQVDCDDCEASVIDIIEKFKNLSKSKQKRIMKAIRTK